MKERAEDAIKPVLEKIKETKKEIDETRKKINETKDEWKKYKEEGVRALADVRAEIVKLKAEAGNINVKVNSDQTNKLAERYVEIIKEQKAAQDDLTKAQSGDGNGAMDLGALTEAQKKITDLAKERQLIENGVNKSVLDTAISYDSMSQSEKIIVDMQKERNTQLTENGNKMSAALEKQQILEAQIQQKKIGQATVFTEYKDGLLTASVELEKGKRIEIHDQENIAMAAEVAIKQDNYKKDFDGLTNVLASKLSAQQANLAQTATLYKQFNTFLKDDTKKTSEEMIKMIQAVNEQLRAMIALKAQAGLGGGVAGARAEGGPVDAGKPYLVGENGPEIVIPKSSGTVIPNNQLAGTGQTNNIVVNINGGNYTSEADKQSMAKLVGQELTRQLQLFKLGIS